MPFHLNFFFFFSWQPFPWLVIKLLHPQFCIGVSMNLNSFLRLWCNQIKLLLYLGNTLFIYYGNYFVCWLCWNFLNHDAFHQSLDTIGKPSMNKGVKSLLNNVWTNVRLLLRFDLVINLVIMLTINNLLVGF